MKISLLPLLALTFALVSSGCNLDGSGDSDAAATTGTKTASTATPSTATSAASTSAAEDDDDEVPATSSVNLTGTWTRLGSKYRLKQTGSSLQGTYYEPTDPTVRGAIAGTVSGRNVKMTIAVSYSTKPAENFTAVKGGTINSTNHMTLTVTGGPKFLGNVQQWYRD